MSSLTDRLTPYWDSLPRPLQAALRRSGATYVGSYLALYRERHAAERFAGELLPILAAYRSDPGDRAALARRFDAVLDSLVLPNGVRKTTFPRRQHAAVAALLARPDRPPDGARLRVLDLPSSSGAASLDTCALLQRAYAIESYVLADLCLEVLLDPERGCVYDAEGRLLQVRGRRRFFSLHRTHSGGDAYSPLAALALSPLALRAWWLRRRHPFPPGRRLVPLSLLHPEVEERVRQGLFTPRACDVFALDDADAFDLVISFNLLQRNYFPPERIETGLARLARALREGGFLLTGNNESFGIARKRGGRLEMLHREGEW